jgi:hypothetical protein
MCSMLIPRGQGGAVGSELLGGTADRGVMHDL